MKRVKIFTAVKYRLQGEIDKWIEKENPNIISISGSDAGHDSMVTYVLYEDSKALDNLLKS